MKDRYNRKENQYYIDRRGKCHKYNKNIEDIVSVHYQIASKLYPDARNPDDVLMKLGWVMIGSSCYIHPIIRRKPTQSQINTLDRIGEYEKLTFLHEGHYINYYKYQILCK